MSKKTKKLKPTKVKKTEFDLLPSFPDRVELLKTFGLTTSEYTPVGNVTKNFKQHYTDPADKFTLFSLLFVSTANFIYLKNPELGGIPQRQGKVELINFICKDEDNRTGFFLAHSNIGETGTTKDIFDYLVKLLSFDNITEASISFNILNYLLTHKAFSTFFKAMIGGEGDKFDTNFYNWCKKKLTYTHSEEGDILFFEPQYVVEGMLAISEARGSYNLLMDNSQYVEHLLTKFTLIEKDDPDVIRYKEVTSKPGFKFPNGRESGEIYGEEDIKDDPLFQESIVPDETLVQPFDPNLI